MSYYVIKTRPDEEGLYVVWSTVTDSIEKVGTRDEVAEYLIEAELDRIREDIRGELDMVDSVGTNMGAPMGAGDTIELRDGTKTRQLPVDRLHAYARTIYEGRTKDAESLLD